MGKKINREGTFIGYAMQSGVSKTKANGHPQFVAKLQAVQEYDFESQQFIDITGVEEVEAVGYFVLFGKDCKATLNAKQIKVAYPHLLPLSTRKLNDEDLSETPIQFRVEEREYNKKTTFDVTWIDHVDAIPGGTVGKADDATVDEIEAKYAAAFRELNGGDKPASVPAAKKVAEKKAVGKPVVPGTTLPVDNQAEVDAEEAANKELAKDVAKATAEQQKERAAEAEYNAMSLAEKKTYNKKKKAEAAKAKAGIKKPGKPKIPTVQKPAAPLVEGDEVTAAQKAVEALDLSASCTQDEAWEACEANAHESKTEQLAEAWTEVVQEFGDDAAVEANKAWPEVRDKVLERTISED